LTPSPVIAALRAPADYASAVADPSWRERLAWPLSPGDAYAIGRSRLSAIARAVARMPQGDSRDLAIAVVGRAFVSTLPLVEQAHAVANEARAGVRLEGSAAADFLRGESPAPPASGFSAFKAFGSPSLPFLRALARIRSWTPLRRMPAAVMVPDAVAITHNELLREVAREDGLAIGFRHAEAIYAGVPRGDRLPAPIAEEAVEVLARAMVPDPGLDPAIAERLALLVRSQVATLVDYANLDIAAMRRVRRFPRHIWAGSGGYWPGRVIAIEAMRRGTRISRFDHGHNRALHDIVEFPATIDLLVADELVMPTARMARRFGAEALRPFLPEGRVVSVTGRRRNRDLDAFARAMDSGARAAGRAGTVLYAPHILRGQRQTVPANLPDPVYLDWQLSLVAALVAADVPLMLRPHPQGIFAGRPHPVAAIHPTRTENFEALAARADVFLFDSPYSRVFCKALVTDRPIVYLDFGTPYFAADVEALLRRRCAVLRVDTDDRHRPVLRHAELVDALRSAAAPDRDAVGELRLLLVGEA
jgi:hypothetical protein